MAKAKKYKLKTHKATAKRYRVTGTGKVMRTRQGRSHLRRFKPNRAKRKYSKMKAVTSSVETKRIKKLAPYLGLYRQNPPK